MKFPGRRTVRRLTRRDLHDEIKKTQEHLIQLLEDYMPMEEWGNRKVFMPLVDVKEERDNLIVTTDLPGVNKEDIKLDIKNNVLEISAKTGEEKETEKEGYIRRERSYIRLYRAVHLPASVKEEGTAKMKNGVLTITLPKMKPEEPEMKIKIE